MTDATRAFDRDVGSEGTMKHQAEHWAFLVTRLATILACALGCATAPAPAASTPEATVEEPPAPARAIEIAEPAPPKPVKIDRGHLANVGMDAPLDYADPALWACRPGNDPNECDADLDATEIAKDGSRTVVRHEPSQDPAFDCFYVYPTVKLAGPGNMTDFTEKGIALVRDPLLSQAARFGRLCRVYAPLYRQVGLERTKDGVKPATGSDRALAVSDVRAAFKYYLEHLSEGRKFVLLGHSQGTSVLEAMMQQDLDGSPELRERMISALLIGGRISVAKGKRVGGSFQNIPTCSSPGETGCVIAYVSHAAEARPNADTKFGATTDPNTEIACTEPSALAGNTGRFKGSYMRRTVNNPLFKTDQPVPEGIETPFVLYREALEGTCVKRDGLSYLEVSLEQDADDTRGVPPYRIQRLELGGWGLHIVDYNLPLEDLLAAVELQAASVP